MKTVLAAIDFSPVSPAVIAEATALSRALGGRVVVLNVVQPPMLATELPAVAGELVQRTADASRAARRRLRRLQHRLVEHGVTVETACEQGFPVPFILHEARQEDARYIVLGSHGHSALRRLVLGGTASGVLRHAPCPVVVIPAARRRSKRPAPGARRTAYRQEHDVSAPVPLT